MVDCRHTQAHAGTPDNIIFVDQEIPGSNDGTTWENAFRDLEAAIVAAERSHDASVIRVAAGAYKPSSERVQGRDRTTSFHLANSVTIMGGYAGLGENDPRAEAGEQGTDPQINHPVADHYRGPLGKNAEG